MRISDWSSDVCSSDLPEFSDGAARENGRAADLHRQGPWRGDLCPVCGRDLSDVEEWGAYRFRAPAGTRLWSAQSCLSGALDPPTGDAGRRPARRHRSEEHTSELQSLMRISYAVFCLKKKPTTPY